jgi:hypothetical protein
MHLRDRCRFLNCSVWMGEGRIKKGWEGGELEGEIRGVEVGGWVGGGEVRYES